MGQLGDPPKLILVVDDEVELQRLVKQRFRKKIRGGKLQFRFAQNGVEALQILQDSEEMFDMILTDIRMPEMDGLTLIANLANLESAPKVVVLSAYGDMKNIRTAMNRGAFDFLIKPIDFEDLESTIDNTLTLVSELRHQQHQLQIQSQQRVADQLARLQSAMDQMQAEMMQRDLMERDLRIANHQLKLLAETDALTHVANRRHFDQEYLTAWQHAWTKGCSLSLILFDVDYFKPYNDHYGHQKGDECLVKIAHASRKATFRSPDLLARYGGEEFVILLPETDQAGAVTLTQRVQTEIAALSIPHLYSDVSPIVTASFGIASLALPLDHIPTWIPSAETLLKQADHALYLAKQQGRNQYVVYSTSHTGKAQL